MIRRRETDISTELRLAEEKAAYDSICKRILSHKFILAWILKSCVEEFRDCDVKDIAEKYIEGTPEVGLTAVHQDLSARPLPTHITGDNTEDATVTEGTVTYDLRFRAIAPISGQSIRLIINLEAQNNFYPGYPLTKRGIYYCCRMISGQYNREFTDSDYRKIKKVYSIWICMNPPRKRQNTITKYELAERCLVGSNREMRQNYDLMTMMLLCVGETNAAKENDQALRLLNVLFSSDKRAEEKRRILEDEFQIPMTVELEEEVSAMCNLSDGVEARGMRKGLEQGREQGLEQGREQSLTESIRNVMKNLGLSIEEAMSVLNIPEGEQPIYRELVDAK